MKKIFVFALMLLVFLSCDNDDEKQLVCGTELTMLQNYFPLQVGNEWDFELMGKRVVKEIHTLNNTIFFEIVDAYENSNFYRLDDDKVYVRFQSIESEEELIFDLAAEVNTSWNYGPGQVTLVDREASISIGDIVIDDCLKFIFHSDHLIDYGRAVWLAPGIGFIQETCQECFGQGFSIMQLKSAMINGEKIHFL